MKSFLNFINEATASQQAASLGLVGDGHGGWYDKGTGEFIAKTERGKLKFYNKRQRTPGQDPPQTERERNISNPNYNDPAAIMQDPEMQQAAAQAQAEPAAVEEPPKFLPVEKTKGTLTVAFGRFNPPHAGHAQLMDVAAVSAEADESDYLIVPSRSHDPKKNPLDPDTKVSIMRAMFPQHSERIANDSNTRTIFDVLKQAHNNGYANVRIVGGADRVNEFNKLAHNYNGQLYDFENVEVVSAGDRDPDSEGVEGYSASRMRLAASENDFKSFYQNLHQEIEDEETGEVQSIPLLSRRDAKDYFTNVRQSMGINEEWGIWEMAPKFDQQTLRENYVDNIIFKIGDLIENINTGLRGRIIRRGTSYVICVSEDNIMFKSWIKDINEVTNISGVPATQREVGTDALRRYTEKMVPGSSWGLQFINKYRKKATV